MIWELILGVILIALIGFSLLLLFIDSAKAAGPGGIATNDADINSNASPQEVSSRSIASESRSLKSISGSSISRGDFEKASISSPSKATDQNQAVGLSDAQIRDLVRDMKLPDRGVPLRTRYFKLKKRKNTFSGSEAVEWLQAKLSLGSRADAVAVGELLMYRGLLHNVSREFPFADKRHLLYRFDKDKPADPELTIPNHKFPEIIEQMRMGISKKERKYRNKSWPTSFLGNEAVDWMQKALKLPSRDAAVKLGTELLRRSAFHHVSFSEPFADKPVPYRFFRDEPEWLSSAAGTATGTAVDYTLHLLSDQMARINEQSWDDTRDWKIFQTGAKLVKYTRDSPILSEGTFNNHLYRIRAGSVRVEKKQKILALMDINKTFGEMSVLDPTGLVSASIFANEPDTELYVIEVTWIAKLFETEHLLAERFYKNMATKLARRLTQLTAPAPASSGSPSLVASPSSGTIPRGSSSAERDALKMSTVSGDSLEATLIRSKTAVPAQPQSRDAHFQQLFALSADDVLIKDFAAKWKKKVMYNGTMYVSQRYVCFAAKVFGFHVKLVVPFDRFISLEKGSTSDKEWELRIVAKRSLKKGSADKDKKKEARTYSFKFVNRDVFEEAHKVIDSLWTSIKDKPQNALPRKESNDEDTKSEAELGSLTKDDWDHILKEAKLIKFSRNEIIVQEGDYFQRIFQVGHGKCRVEKLIDGRATVLGPINQQETFGEISFLQGEGATASVIADDDLVEIYVIEGSLISKLFDSRPGIAGRFFKYLAVVINNRIRVREDAAKK